VDGNITILSKEGAIVGEIIVPGLPEISSIFIPDKTKDFLYFTERHCNSVMKLKLGSILDEIKKYHEEQN
jgi:hypothetical protein